MGSLGTKRINRQQEKETELPRRPEPYATVDLPAWIDECYFSGQFFENSSETGSILLGTHC